MVDPEFVGTDGAAVPAVQSEAKGQKYRLAEDEDLEEGIAKILMAEFGQHVEEEYCNSVAYELLKKIDRMRDFKLMTRDEVIADPYSQ